MIIGFRFVNSHNYDFDITDVCRDAIQALLKQLW